MKYLISTTETYRVDSEGEAQQLINEAKEESMYELKKYTSVRKTRKSKGEVIDEWFQVTLTKVFDDEKEPCGQATVKYTNGAF